MVGVDRGNPPAKGGTICCQSAKHRHRTRRTVWQADMPAHGHSVSH